MIQAIRQWLIDQCSERLPAQGLVEYALILVLLSTVAVAIMLTLGTSVSSVFSQANAGF
ncbi:MAG: Flp family type IVb pilin [Chloroflexota bacterium]